MLQPRQDPDLAQEPLGSLVAEDLGAHDLDGDGAVVLAVAGQVDGGHAAAAQLALHGVAIAQGRRLGAGVLPSEEHTGSYQRGTAPSKVPRGQYDSVPSLVNCPVFALSEAVPEMNADPEACAKRPVPPV